jgi:hypothetical protein
MAMEGWKQFFNSTNLLDKRLHRCIPMRAMLELPDREANIFVKLSSKMFTPAQASMFRQSVRTERGRGGVMKNA